MMGDSKYPKSAFPNPTLSEFLVGEPLEQATGGLITEEDFLAKRARLASKRPEGTEKKTFQELSEDEKFQFLYTSSQQTQRDQLQNSIRLYGIKRNDAKGETPTQILRRVCKDGLKLDDEKSDTITTSALRFIQRVEGGKCIVFQLNRADLVKKIFENIGNLKDFQNPWNKNSKIAITRNLCPEDNRIRSECLTVKEMLREKGFQDVKIRFNKIISVNGGDWHDYNWFLEHKFQEASAKEDQMKSRERAESEGDTGKKKSGKRKKSRDDESTASSSSDTDDRPSTTRQKKAKDLPRSSEKPKDQRPSSGKKHRCT